MQVHGGAGVSQDFPLASLYAGLRTLRWADGPDEVHLQQQGQTEVSEGGEEAMHACRADMATRPHPPPAQALGQAVATTGEDRGKVKGAHGGIRGQATSLNAHSLYPLLLPNGHLRACSWSVFGNSALG